MREDYITCKRNHQQKILFLYNIFSLKPMAFSSKLKPHANMSLPKLKKHIILHFLVASSWTVYM